MLWPRRQPISLNQFLELTPWFPKKPKIVFFVKLALPPLPLATGESQKNLRKKAIASYKSSFFGLDLQRSKQGTFCWFF